MPILNLLFTLPLAASAVLFLLTTASAFVLKRLALILSLIPLALLIASHHVLPGTNINYPWLPALSIHFYLNVDNLSQLFLYLTAIIVPISIMSAPSYFMNNPNVFYGLILLLEGLLIGFFTARDLALFTIFWEGMLIPLYFIISIWGGPKRQYASLKFLIYMIAGSALMVGAVLALFFEGGGSFDMDQLMRSASGVPHAAFIGAIFLLAFAVKTPLFPFHAWLPDAYYQAPTAGTILLSAILSKAGIYGILRIGFGFFPELLQAWGSLLLALAIAGVLYGGMAAWMQQDFKRLIAYSSLSHINFVLAGLFVWNETAHAGAVLQALNHGVTIAALFLVAGWLERRLGTTSMAYGHGLAKFFPSLCWLTLFFVLSSVALPGTNNFVGELMILFGIFGHNPWQAGVLGLTVILSVIYMLRWMQHTYFGPPKLPEQTSGDLHVKEWVTALPLIFLILWIGIYPKPILEKIEPTSTNSTALTQELSNEP